MQGDCTKRLPPSLGIACRGREHEAQAPTRSSFKTSSVMKNAINNQVFAAAVKAKVEKADAIGTKTSWDTADHLKALAEALATVEIAPGQEPKAAFLEILEDGYNISGFAQMLEKVPAFAAKGHFQRASKKAPTANEFYRLLGIGNEVKSEAAAPAPEAK